MKKLEVLKHEVIEKGWGFEFVFHNGEYAFKLLAFREGGKGSFHHHRIKEETWHIHSGKIMLTTVDPETGKESKLVVNEGSSIHIPAGIPHQVEALESTQIYEASTHHSDDDTYRIAPGDSQK